MRTLLLLPLLLVLASPVQNGAVGGDAPAPSVVAHESSDGPSPPRLNLGDGFPLSRQYASE
jgi:hypothetical protein